MIFPVAIRTKNDAALEVLGAGDPLLGLRYQQASTGAGITAKPRHKSTRAPVADFWIEDLTLGVESDEISPRVQSHYHIFSDHSSLRSLSDLLPFVESTVYNSSSEAWLDSLVQISSFGEPDIVRGQTAVDADTPEVIVQARLADSTDAYPFGISESLASMVLASQAGPASVAADGLSVLSDVQFKITSRLIEAVAEVAYRRRRAGAGSVDLVIFDGLGAVTWCENEFAKLVSNSLNLSLLSAGEVLKHLFRELQAWLKSYPIDGRWGRLSGEGNKIGLIVAPFVRAELRDDFL